MILEHGPAGLPESLPLLGGELDDLGTGCKLMYVEITSVGATAVPEPAMLALLGALLGAAAMRRRRS